MNAISALFKIALLGSLLTAVQGGVVRGEQPAGQLAVGNVRCEYSVNPLGIDTPRPRMSWELTSSERDVRQSAYQILVGEDPHDLESAENCLWDTGKVASNQTLHIEYRGPPIKSCRRYFWKVRAWDGEGRPGKWSEVGWWETAFLDPGEWQASWINDGQSNPDTDTAFYQDDPAPLFRNEFDVDKTIKQARLYASGLGYYEAQINGHRVGSHMLDPAWTAYDQGPLYSTYDVTDQLRTGRNCLGAMVGNGWYNLLPLRMWGQLKLRDFVTSGRPRLLLQLVVDYEDGSRQVVATNKSWKTSAGPVLRNSVYLGEVYDARREQSGWSEPGFDDRHWRQTTLAAEPVGPLRAQVQPPIQETAIRLPGAVLDSGNGAKIYDMGQNLAGWARVRLQGTAGTRVRLRYGELLHKDGSLNVMTTVCGQIKQPGVGGPGAPDVAEQCDTYVLRGDGVEVYTPRFTYHAFRYVEITSDAPDLDVISVEGISVNTNVNEAGTFACSNDLLNQIQQLVRNTLPCNLMGVQTDCPGRERLAYGDDIACAAEAHLYNYDMATFYAKTARDFADEARPNGALTLLAPWTGHSIGGFDPGGGSFADPNGGDDQGTGAMSGIIAHPLLLDKLYQFYGDRRLLEEQYETSRKSLEFVRSQAQGNIVSVGLGDWSSVEATDTAVLDTAHYYHHAEIVARLAKVLGRASEAAEYAALASEIKASFVGRWFDPATGNVDGHTQAAQAFAIRYGLLPPDQVHKAAGVLIENVREHNHHMTTGIFGTKYLLEALTQIGRAELAFAIVNQSDYPSWGFMLAQGATTMWEVWDFSDNVYSHNHSMFGTVSAWFFSALGGIRPDPAAIGFDKIIINPQLVSGLTWVNSSYDSIRGKIESNWRRETDCTIIEVTIPPNTSANVFLPALSANEVTEGGQPITLVPGISFLYMQGNKAVFRIGSGSYAFRCPTGEAGFVSLFDGKSFHGWTGGTDSFAIENDTLISQPGSRGNLLTEKEYADFVLRFDFRLTPGANSGLGIRVPGEGHPSYDGIELQILDDDAEKYRSLHDYQYHGSVYGVAPALRGSLRPAGQWNRQEVRCQGRRVLVINNGMVIVDVDLDEAAPAGKTIDQQVHAGLNRQRGHIGLLCHDDVVEFRNIRIKELSSDAPQQQASTRQE